MKAIVGWFCACVPHSIAAEYATLIETRESDGRTEDCLEWRGRLTWAFRFGRRRLLRRASAAHFLKQIL